MDHPRWKGGRSKQTNGYVTVWIAIDDPFASMRGDKGRVYEHRLVVARSLGRPLGRYEEVHHINGRKADNRLRNLRLLGKSEHSEWHANRIRELEREVRHLRRTLRQAARP